MRDVTILDFYESAAADTFNCNHQRSENNNCHSFNRAISSSLRVVERMQVQRQHVKRFPKSVYGIQVVKMWPFPSSNIFTLTVVIHQFYSVETFIIIHKKNCQANPRIQSHFVDEGLQPDTFELLQYHWQRYTVRQPNENPAHTITLPELKEWYSITFLGLIIMCSFSPDPNVLIIGFQANLTHP